MMGKRDIYVLYPSFNEEDYSNTSLIKFSVHVFYNVGEIRNGPNVESGCFILTVMLDYFTI